MKRHYFIYPLLAWMAMFLLPSCVREDLLHDEENVIPGLETTISLKINVPDMDVATRADMAPGTDSKLNSLWVGIFSATSGDCTYAGFVDEFPSDVHGDFLKLTINTKSGSSYIVAVGNPEGNYGYRYTPDSENPIGSESLKDLLPENKEDAETKKFKWEDYKNIVISRRSIDNIVDDPSGNLPMSGIYYKDKTDPTPEGWEDANETPVMIPAVAPGETIALEGAIHLRRLISQVKFEIRPGNNPGKDGRRIIRVSPQSYRVINAPALSWLHERKTREEGQPSSSANAGDLVRIEEIGEGSYDYKSNYMKSPVYRGSQYIKTTEQGDNPVYSFDFWMLENKRWALGENELKYEEREKERKYDAGDNDGLNTGIYTALCGEGGDITMNNAAAFVELRCRIDYIDPAVDAGSNVIERTAEVIYTIHLGGVKHNWNDFAHRRNHKYTYGVTVVDVDKILVEAHPEDGTEERPDIEGVVTDILKPSFRLDAHYHVFNIQLSNKQRTGGTDAPYKDNLFPFRLQLWDREDVAVIIKQDNYEKFPNVAWNWVEFRRASDATDEKTGLAAYKPYYVKDQDGNDTDVRYQPAQNDPEYKNGLTFRLNEIADIETYPGPRFAGETEEAWKNPDDEKLRWYTVFVNEYTYETSTNETTNNWVYYVNKPDRVCWLNTKSGESTDKESLHIESQYYIVQSSIQSFYDVPKTNSQAQLAALELDAIGMEHTNEVYGLTLRWGDVDEPTNDQSLTNGKYNQVEYLRGGVSGDTHNHSWSKYFQQNKLQEITGINTESYQVKNLPDHAGLILEGKEEERTFYVPNIITRTYNEWGLSPDRKNFTPNLKYILLVMNSCLNRNRDNNGDGYIDRSEIRWYLPSSGELVDLVNGRNSLEHPLMDYDSNPQLLSPNQDVDNNKHHVNTRFHYAASNKRLLWAEEGITINTVSDNENDWNRMGWQVRCTRALGTNLRDDAFSLSPAFVTDDDDAPTMIYPKYFEEKTLREPFPENEPFPVHSETSTFNRIATTGFEFSKTLLEWQAAGWGWEWGWGQPEVGVSYKYNAEALKKDMTHEYIVKGRDACRALDDTENGNWKRGWRMPTIKECSVLKLAMNSAGLNYPGNPGNENRAKVWKNGKQYEIGNFFASTYREYGVNENWVDGIMVNDKSDSDPTGYYLGVVYEDSTQGRMGRAQCLTDNQPRYFVRCVRDLNPGEFPAARLQ